MYAMIAFPLDVIKTNRIVGSQITKEAGENLPREMLSIYERGALSTGLYRGLAPAATLALLSGLNVAVGGKEIAFTPGNGLVAATATATIWTALYNPLVNLQTLKQVIRGSELEPKTYRQLISETGAARIVSLGLSAHLLRNLVIMQSFFMFKNTDFEPIQMLFGLGALLVSHPFEVARVMIVNGEKSRMIGSTASTLQSLYASEGIAGCYKGFIPRTLYTLPIMMAVGWSINTPNFNNTHIGQTLQSLNGGRQID